MDEFWKASGLILVSVILCLTIGKGEKDYAVLLSLAVCSVAGAFLVLSLSPVLRLLWELNSLVDTGNDFLGILLKAAGISLAAELASLICCDAGNNSLGKMTQMLGQTAILTLSIPVVRALVTLIQQILLEL